MVKINASAPRRWQPACLLSPSCRGGAAFPRPGEPLLAPEQCGPAAYLWLCWFFGSHSTYACPTAVTHVQSTFFFFFWIANIIVAGLSLYWDCFSLRGRGGESWVFCPDFRAFSKAELELGCCMMQQDSPWREVAIASSKLKYTSSPDVMHELCFGIISDTVNTRMCYKWEHLGSRRGGLWGV